MKKPLSLLCTVLLAGCPPGGDPSNPGRGADGEGQDMAVLATASSDAATGSFATASLDDWSVQDQLFITSGDPQVRVEDGHVLQLNRFGHDSLRLYRPGEWEAPVWEQSTGDTSNPWDVEICGGELFVALYDTDRLGVFDLDSGLLTGAVDLSAFNDADGPEPSSLAEIDGKLYVGLNRMDRSDGWESVGGQVVEVDCAGRAITRSWEVGGNTVVYRWPGSSRILVGATAHGDQEGGLYILDPDADSVSLIASEAALGGEVSGVATDGDKAVTIALVPDLSGYTVSCLDLGSGAITEAERTDSYLSAIAANDRGEAWIAARYPWSDPTSPYVGAIVYEIESCTSLTEETPVAFSLAPVSIAFY